MSKGLLCMCVWAYAGVGVCGCGWVQMWMWIAWRAASRSPSKAGTKAIEFVKPFKSAKSRPSAIHLAREWVDSSKESMHRASKQESQRGKSCERHP
jgi:hypothetical protein